MADLRTEDRITELLFRLPPELRNVIYAQCLPDELHHAVIRDRSRDLRWLACSQQLFTEAATLFYTSVPLYACTALPRGANYAQYGMHGDLRGRQYLMDSMSLTGDFDYHLRTTYGKRDARALRTLASHMVKDLRVDMRVVNYDKAQDLPDRIRTYFEGLAETFTGLKRLDVYFAHSFMAADPDLIDMKYPSKSGWVDVKRTSYELALREAMAAARETMPAGCRMRWKVSTAWNLIDLAPATVKRL